MMGKVHKPSDYESSEFINAFHNSDQFWYHYSMGIINIVFSATSCINDSKFISHPPIFTEDAIFSSLKCCLFEVSTSTSIQALRSFVS